MSPFAILSMRSTGHGIRPIAPVGIVTGTGLAILFIVLQTSYEALIGRNCVRKVLNFGHVDVPSANSASRVIRFSTFEVNLTPGNYASGDRR
jgi:hypothetical protein